MARHLADRELTEAPGKAASAAGAPDGFALATPRDEAEVRTLLRRVVMPGAVRVAFTREPDYFAGEGLAGADDRTLIHRADGPVNAVARLSLHTLHRNGTARRVGYLGELRVAPDARHGARILRDGFDILHRQVRENHVEGCFTSIATDNVRARRVLEQGRRFGLPVYTPIADLVTRVVPVNRATREAAADGTTGPAAAPVDRDELTGFLQRHARSVQLSLSWDDARWQALAEHGVGLRDFSVVRERGRIVAAAAVWDQRAFKQTVICGYDGLLQVSRPLVNLLARFGVAPLLPQPGTTLALASVLGMAVDSDTHWATLWNTLRQTAAHRSIDWLVLAREARDPQLSALRQCRRGREYHTRLYDVRWSDAPAWPDRWDASPFRPEVALL
ncbi:MAG: hypothetical protein IPP90_09350 [Gemmatimonadaceae bacterium]|nr:hypothetical protein [Gemmatimonadaceae bacterium]